MNIAITGHSKGIGKALLEELSKRNHGVVGFSRSNGHDIDKESIRQIILTKMKDVDVFINNAFSIPGQYKLLESVIDSWKTEDKKMIVHIGSIGVFNDNPSYSLNWYCKEKKKQHDLICKYLLKSSPKILNILPGFVDTEMAKSFDVKKICPKDLAITISNIIESKENIFCKEIILVDPKQNYNFT